MINLCFFPITILTLLLSFQAPVWAETSAIVLTDDIQMVLGDAFLAEGDYYRAVTEYKKLTILFPDSDRLPEAPLQYRHFLLPRKRLRGPPQKVLPKFARHMPPPTSVMPPFMRG